MAGKQSSRGAELAQRLSEGRSQAEKAPLPGARAVDGLVGLAPNCTANRPLENVLVQAQKFLVDSGRVYRYGNNVMMETDTTGEAKLVTLATGSKIETSAAPLLANLFVCRSTTPSSNTIEFTPPSRFVATLLHREPSLAALPLIRIYAPRPVFDQDFVLRGPGWHPAVGILVHGMNIEPVIPDEVDQDVPAIDRLPPHLHNLLKDFPFKEDADVANTVAVLLTGLLITLFISTGHPVVLLDGNQPGLGKTLLVRVIGVVLDGIDPRIIHYSADDEELQKRICATLRGSNQSQVLIDNAKVTAETAIHSAVLEANSMAPEISLRILGKSEIYTRPNDLVWFLTMNNTKASPDLVSRGMPIRQHYEGDPKKRKFENRDPLRYARGHRAEILGELAGMVTRWNQTGRPEGDQNHRLTEWARTIGGIMCANGFPEFLTNLDTAAAEFNTALDMLAALAEAAVSSKSKAVVMVDKKETLDAE
jgi:hypothetical protein